MDLYIELPRPPPQTFICAFGPPLSCLFPMQKSSSTLLQIQESLSRAPQAAAQAINPYARACRLPLSSKCRSPFSKRRNPYVELPRPPPQTVIACVRPCVRPCARACASVQAATQAAYWPPPIGLLLQESLRGAPQAASTCRNPYVALPRPPPLAPPHAGIPT